MFLPLRRSENPKMAKTIVMIVRQRERVLLSRIGEYDDDNVCGKFSTKSGGKEMRK